MYKRASPETTFPERTCEGCGRHGGGDPNSTLDKVLLYFDRPLCGHCRFELEDWFAEQRQAAITAWVAEKRKKKHLTKENSK